MNRALAAAVLVVLPVSVAFGQDNSADCHDMECWDQNGKLMHMAPSGGCQSDMPCALSPEAALRQAFQYCSEDFYHATVDIDIRDCICSGDFKGSWDLATGNICASVANGQCKSVSPDDPSLPRTYNYTLPACDGIAKRWASSTWKKADDAADAKLRQHAIDHAKAFVEAVEKGE